MLSVSTSITGQVEFKNVQTSLNVLPQSRSAAFSGSLPENYSIISWFSLYHNYDRREPSVFENQVFTSSPFCGRR